MLKHDADFKSPSSLKLSAFNSFSCNYQRHAILDGKLFVHVLCSAQYFPNFVVSFSLFSGLETKLNYSHGCTVKHGSRKAQRHQFHIHMAWRVVNQSMGEININGGKLSLHNRIHFHYAMLWVESVWFEWKELCGCRSSASIAVAILQINKQQKQGNDIFTMD